MSYPLRGYPFNQNAKTALVDTGMTCFRMSANVSRMCELILRTSPLPAKQIEIDWDKHWAIADGLSDKPRAYTETHKTCVVLGGSSMLTLYDYTEELLAADVVFGVNGVHGFVPPNGTKLLETADAEHLKQAHSIKWLDDGGKLLLTTANTFGEISADKKHELAYPGGQGLMISTAKAVGVPFAGYTSGLSMVHWARQRCDNVKVIGFYGFDEYEHGRFNYSNTRKSAPTEKTGQAKAMLLFARLHELGQIEFVI